MLTNLALRTQALELTFRAMYYWHGVAGDDGSPRSPARFLTPSFNRWIIVVELDRIKCCVCTCEPQYGYPCGFGGFACEDPACVDPAVVAEFPNCTGGWLGLGDGFCEEEKNNPECGYDGGDCCVCSCSGNACLLSVFDCLDPDAGDQFFECEPPPSDAVPCSAEAQQTWLVESSEQARALASAVNCSGGSFYVEWRGHVVVDETVYVVDGTVLTVNGADAGGVMDGNGSSRLFTVVDASLHLNGVDIVSGAGMVGGAIATARSNLTLNRTSLIGNSATAEGGAIFLSDGSTASCDGGVTFSDNRAALDGGALFATGASTVLCGGSWLNNAAGDSGGAVRLHGGSSMSWANRALFEGNAAGRNAGVMSVYNQSRVSWSGGETEFANNSAIYAGGGILAVRSEVSWIGSTSFAGNRADVCGAVCAYFGSNVSWSGEGLTRFIGQNVSTFGGAMYVVDSSVSWTGDTEFESNHGATGAAMFLMNGSSISWTGDTRFASNEASADGGVVGSHVSDSLYNPQDSVLFVNGSTVFSNNSCGANGGALALLGSCSVVFGAAAGVGFVNNSAAVEGGAVFLSSNEVGPTFAGISFVSNSAQVGGAVSAFASGNREGTQDSPTTFDRCLFLDNTAFATGGAVESAAGQEIFVSSVFEGNKAGTGGALRLGGAAHMYNCSFVENVSGDGGGAAVSNIGVISSMENISFSGNMYDCQEGTFLDYKEVSSGILARLV